MNQSEPNNQQWVTRLREIAGRVDDPKAWSPNLLDADLFGEYCLLPCAFKEALAAESPPQLEEVAGLLKRLQNAPHFTFVYDIDSIGFQGKHLLWGMAKTIRAACHYLVRGKQLDHQIVQLLCEAATAYDTAWPGDISNRPLPRESPDQLFREYAGARKGQTLGFWIVWDLLDLLLGESRPGRNAARVTSATVAVPLYEELSGNGQMALLTVELIHDGGAGFCPDPLGLGLTTLVHGGDPEKDIHRSLQHVYWEVAGMRDRCCRGRWRITGYWPEAALNDEEMTAPEPLCVPYLQGRSLEAAVCCALWAALGEIPGSETVPDELLPLDTKSTMTASLEIEGGEESGDQKPRVIRLGKVSGLIAKRDAAARAGLEMMLISDQVRDGTSLSTEGIDVFPVSTVQEAFEQLLKANRYVRAYQEHRQSEWKKQWPIVLGDDNG